MWIIESEYINIGGYIEYGKFYRLKHLSTGFFLGVKRNSQDGKSQKKSENINDYY